MGLYAGTNSFGFDAGRVAVSSVDITSSVQGAQSATITVSNLGSGMPGGILIGPPGGGVYTYLDITVQNIDWDSVNNVTIYFMVPKSWLESSGIDKSSVSMYTYDYGSGAWVPLPTWIVGEDGSHVYYAAVAGHLSPMAVAGGAITGGAAAPGFDAGLLALAASVVAVAALGALRFRKPGKR
jgi:PGF-pre-PGF domain-containing protein